MESRNSIISLGRLNIVLSWNCLASQAAQLKFASAKGSKFFTVALFTEVIITLPRYSSIIQIYWLTAIQTHSGRSPSPAKKIVTGNLWWSASAFKENTKGDAFLSAILKAFGFWSSRSIPSTLSQQTPCPSLHPSTSELSWPPLGLQGLWEWVSLPRGITSHLSPMPYTAGVTIATFLWRQLGSNLF